MKYKTGDVQKILGISGETLRFFESKGLLVPQRDNNNNYRYYDTLDLNKIVAYKFYRGFEFTLEESLEMINLRHNEESLEILAQKEIYIEEKCNYYKELHVRIKELKRSFEGVGELQNTMNIENSPELLFYHNQVNDEFETDELRMETTKRWLEHLPFVYLSIYTSGEILPIGKDIHYGYAVPTKYKHVVKALQNTLTHIYPTQKCIHTIIKSTEGKPLSSKNLVPVLEYIKEQGFELKGDIIGWIINEENYSTGKVRYFEMWFPIG